MRRTTAAERIANKQILCPVCDTWISINARRCPGCKMALAYGSLGLRLAARVKRSGIAVKWVMRFLHGNRLG